MGIVEESELVVVWVRRDTLTFGCLEHLSATVVELQLLIDDRGPARVLEVSSPIADTKDL